MVTAIVRLSQNNCINSREIAFEESEMLRELLSEVVRVNIEQTPTLITIE